MKWFFCWCQDSDFRSDHNWKDLIRVSVGSARRFTTLEPNLIYDGEPSKFTDELTAAGVNVIFHRLSFTSAIVEYHSSKSEWQAVARGAFLRFDIPLVAELEDEVVLYTDADVIFQSDPDFAGYVPTYIAAAPEFERGNKRDMNSGVMLMNLKTFRKIHEKLIDFTEANLHLGLDQEVLREFVGQDYLLLPDIYNWKPYWGINANAPILHFHGPKPVTIKGLLEGSITCTHLSWHALFERDRDAYAYYAALHQDQLFLYHANRCETLSRFDNISQGKLVTTNQRLNLPPGLLAEKVSINAEIEPQEETYNIHIDIRNNPWWQVDLDGIATIAEIHIYGDGNIAAGTFCDFVISFSIDGHVWADQILKKDGDVTKPCIWAGPGTAWARYVRVTSVKPDLVYLRKVDVFGWLQ